MTALIEGFFGFVWFGWGQAYASAGLSAGLAVAGVVALLVAVAGLATDVAPSTVTGVGAGTLPTVLGLAALAGVHVERTSQLSSPISS
jgi:hypothetical protein